MTKDWWAETVLIASGAGFIIGLVIGMIVGVGIRG